MSGWTYECACGWRHHSKPGQSLDEIAEPVHDHHAQHREQIAALRERTTRGESR